MISEWLRDWLLGIIAAGLLVSVLYALLPRGRMQTVARGIGGVILLLVILRPVMGWEWEDVSLSSYEDCRRELETLTEEYRQSADRELAALIEEKTAAYIASRGSDLGAPCTARVETALRDGVPYPVSVTLDIPRHEALSAWLTQELEIGEAYQHWRTEESEVEG